MKCQASSVSHGNGGMTSQHGSPPKHHPTYGNFVSEELQNTYLRTYQREQFGGIALQ